MLSVIIITDSRILVNTLIKIFEAAVQFTSHPRSQKKAKSQDLAFYPFRRIGMEETHIHSAWGLLHSVMAQARITNRGTFALFSR